MNDVSIEKIRSDIFAYDFGKAKELGIHPSKGDYESYAKQDWSESSCGELSLNTASEFYPLFKGTFENFNGVPTEEIIKLYKELDSYYPDDNDFPDVDKYETDSEKKNIIVKILMKVELSRRERGIANIQKLLGLILGKNPTKEG
jgi:hypothetical protein